MEFLFTDWLGTPAWFWLSFLFLVIALTAFDLGVLHKEDREMGIGESLKLSAFYIGIAMLFTFAGGLMLLMASRAIRRAAVQDVA